MVGGHLALDQVAQRLIQPGLEHYQGWDITTSLGNPFQCLTTCTAQHSTAQNVLLYASLLNLGYDNQNGAVSAAEVTLPESLKVFLCCSEASSSCNRFPIESRNMRTSVLSGCEEGWGWMRQSASVLLSPGCLGEAQCT